MGQAGELRPPRVRTNLPLCTRETAMKSIAALVVISTLMVGVAAATAEEQMATSLIKTEEGGHSVFFEYESCGGECYVGSISCNSGGGSIEFTFGDVASEAAASVVASEEHKFRLAAGDAWFDFTAHNMTFQEMTGSWSVTGQAVVDMAPFFPAVIKSKVFTAEIGKIKLELPVTADVSQWAKACGG